MSEFERGSEKWFQGGRGLDRDLEDNLDDIGYGDEARLNPVTGEIVINHGWSKTEKPTDQEAESSDEFELEEDYDSINGLLDEYIKLDQEISAIKGLQLTKVDDRGREYKTPQIPDDAEERRRLLFVLFASNESKLKKEPKLREIYQRFKQYNSEKYN